MKKGIFAVLVIAFVMLMAGTALAVPPTVIDETAPAYGRSAWTYEDLQDPGPGPGDAIAPKYEGGYAMFDDTANLLYTASPHGGYDTTTNKCKVCHAVHRAEGAYYLLRADSQDDACDYCHIGGSAHSPMVVYDLNAAGKYTPNGHTIGACATIPDSTVYQEAVPVTLSSYDCETGSPTTEDIEVRSYDAEKNSMYRFSRHHAQSAAGTGRSGYLKIGPLSLRCMNCHQPHNATDMVWTTERVYDWFGISTGPAAPYKLLRAYPSGTTTGPANSYGYYDASQAVRVPETTLTAGVNYSTKVGMEFVVAATGRTAPNWVTQNFYRDGETASTLNPQGSPASVTNLALSVWCADCHNLNIGFRTNLNSPELGFKAHTERTHPVPYTAGHGGPSQCYTCHRNDLPPRNSGFDACSQCHYGTGSYWAARVSVSNPNFTDSDFPHSGRDTDHKLLGSYSIQDQANWSTLVTTTITEDNLDAVCLRCHPGVGVHY
jgi:hypothetical protein